MNTDRPVLGILLMLGFCVLAPLGDSMAKLLGGSMGVGQLVTVRFALQVAILAPIVWFTGKPLAMRGRVLRLTMIRTTLHILGIGMMFLALRYLPLADALAIAFVMPFIMLILGYFVLGEEVGHRRIIACGVGFVGTLFVIQPSFAQVGLPALLPLGVALDFALFMLVTRQVAKDVDPISLQATSGLIAAGMLLPLMLIATPFDIPGLAMTPPAGDEWVLLLALGGIGTFAHLLMTWSLRFAPSATLAPMQYLEIPVAAALGWLIFRDFPNGMALLGICITISAGLYIIAREQRLSRSVTTPQTPAPPAA
ncbi:DMT family transporter [Boseongicola aestuarii]|uniref:Riboflavin transporter n=1 Tax=Boseongicola aestuarii TaxID=1470561 RepID=A0A238IYI2_9RHOB|nr:DMT family transporter [Boseongicola aestuarii]SMX23538.1 Riboflavin transporter [Boseongicola aestuarii]